MFHSNCPISHSKATLTHSLRLNPLRSDAGCSGFKDLGIKPQRQDEAPVFGEQGGGCPRSALGRHLDLRLKKEGATEGSEKRREGEDRASLGGSGGSMWGDLD